MGTPTRGKTAAAPSPPRDVVDASVLDGLIELTRVERQVEAFRARALEMKDTVEPAVSARVLGDYDARLRALRAEAAPLRARARAEFEKLRALYGEVDAREARARLDKQELEFRRAVGEIDEPDLRERVKEPDAVLLACRADRTELDRHKARFLEVFTEEELAAPARPPEDVTPAAGLAVEPAPRAGAMAAAPAAAPELDATMLAPLDAMDVTMLAAPDSAVPAEEEGEAEHTVLLPDGVLIVVEADGTETPHRLSATTSIGRADDNQIRIQRAGVSRRHALVVADRTGFRIEDLGSQNGTFVNGGPVQRGLLSHGDVITLGDAMLRFEMPGTRHP